MHDTEVKPPAGGRVVDGGAQPATGTTGVGTVVGTADGSAEGAVVVGVVVVDVVDGADPAHGADVLRR